MLIVVVPAMRVQRINKVSVSNNNAQQQLQGKVTFYPRTKRTLLS